MSLAGSWRKIPSDPCDRLYPDEIEFKEATYLGKKGPEQGFIVWDAGIYEIVGPDEVKISIATDELVLYRFSISGDILTVTDREGCEFRYRRAG